jgi:sugar lactone lactonase YvrE
MPEHLSSLLDSTEPTLLTTGWGRTEGPLWHAAGSVTCVDVASSRLLRWDTSGQVRVVRERTGEGNGCTLDRQGRLIMCEEADHRRITRMDGDRTVTTIAAHWREKRFNKPNDVVCCSDGSLFFTDPALRLAPARREIGFSGVYRLDPQGEVPLAPDACAYPNGLAFSPDASILYVAISRLDQRCFEEEQQGAVCTHRRIRALDVAPDGRLSTNRMFCDMSSADPGVPDGLTVDTAGRVLCVGSGRLWVIAPSGEVIGVIRTPEVVRHLAFGGRDFRTLYLTPGSSLSTLEVQTPGIGPRSSGGVGPGGGWG